VLRYSSAAQPLSERGEGRTGEGRESDSEVHAAVHSVHSDPHSPSGMIDIKVVQKTAVSEMDVLPASLTKCNAHPIGMNTRRTLLRGSAKPRW
jgi:hypothetical protein